MHTRYILQRWCLGRTSHISRHQTLLGGLYARAAQASYSSIPCLPPVTPSLPLFHVSTPLSGVFFCLKKLACSPPPSRIYTCLQNALHIHKLTLGLSLLHHHAKGLMCGTDCIYVFSAHSYVFSPPFCTVTARTYARTVCVLPRNVRA